MARFRKKPVVIEAIAWNGKYCSPGEWPDWFRDAISSGVLEPQTNGTLRIKTLEGEMVGNSGDKIIQGVKREIYACKPDIFEQTYEAVI
jgi:hypothetical protein